MGDVKLSIIMPVYGVEKYIEKCLYSVLNQLTKDCELIIINDQTPDSSIKLCRTILEDHNYPNVRIIERDKNGGLSAARNTGIEHARGDYCWFIDSDDYISEKAIRSIINNLNECFEILIFNHRRVDQNGVILHESKLLDTVYDVNKSNENLIGDYLRNNWGFEVWSKVYSMKIIRDKSIRFEPNKEIFAEDICFFLYFSKFVNSIRIISDCNYFYLIRNDSIMGRKQCKVKEMFNLTKKIEQDFGDDSIREIILPKLLEIEIKVLDEDMTRHIKELQETEYIGSLHLFNAGLMIKRINMYGLRAAFKQELLIWYLKRINNNKKTLLLERLYNNQG